MDKEAFKKDILNWFISGNEFETTGSCIAHYKMFKETCVIATLRELVSEGKLKEERMGFRLVE